MEDSYILASVTVKNEHIASGPGRHDAKRSRIIEGHKRLWCCRSQVKHISVQDRNTDFKHGYMDTTTLSTTTSFQRTTPTPTQLETVAVSDTAQCLFRAYYTLRLDRLFTGYLSYNTDTAPTEAH